MVGDIIPASKCGTQFVKTNATVGMFTLLKKLKLSEKKCSRLLNSKKNCETCPAISPLKNHMKKVFK